MPTPLPLPPPKKRKSAKTEAKQALERAKRGCLEYSFDTLYTQLGGIGDWTRNHKFCQERGYELDRALPDLKVAVEINGGQWMDTSGHRSGKALHRDAHKQNLCVVHGWRLFWLTTDKVDQAHPEHIALIVIYINNQRQKTHMNKA